MEPVLETDAGPARGAREGALRVFRGVPYAASPVGALRFAPPQPAPRWRGVRDALRFGPAPPQRPDLWSERLGLRPGFATDEDCLSLNAWAPEAPGRRPVLVWIPGGAFLTGTGGAPLYDGARLARRGDAVVVTLSYRVGALGFLFLDGAGGLSAANLGLQDQLAALAWVRAHAERLGGDPARITVFGESAGAGSVAALLAMPAAQGAFRRAIAQSPACEGMLAPEEAARRTALFLAKLGAGAAGLRDVAVERLLAAQAECLAEGPFATGMLFPPVVDGALLPELPVEAVARGAAAGVDLVIGTTADEMMLYGADEPAGVPDAARAALLAAQLGGDPGAREARAQGLLDAYRDARAARGASASARDVFYAVLTDLHLRRPALRLAEAHARAGGRAFAYLFEWRSPLRGGAYGACHALDLAFTFGNLDVPGIVDFAGSGPAARRLADEIMDAWAAFAARGDPSHPGIGPWLPYTEEGRDTMRFGERSGAARAPLEAERAAWDLVAGRAAPLRECGRRPAIPGGGPQSAAAVLDAMLAREPGREALVGRHGRLSYAELDREANRAARALAALGVRAGDRVAACLPNDVDLVVAFLACMRMGAIWVGVNRALAPPEQAYVLGDAGAAVLLAAPEAARALEPHRAALPELAHVLRVDPGGADDAWRARLAAADGAERPGAAIDPFAPAAIAYTSGTSGHPKGAVHSQHNLLLPGAVALTTARYPQGVRIGVVLPLTILNLVVLGPLTAWQLGTACVAVDRVDPEGLAAWIRRERIGSFAGVPTIFHDLLTHPGVRADDLAPLVAPEVGGAECPEEFRALWRERFGAEVRVGYGMTEAPTAVAWTDGTQATQPGICGRAQPQLEISIRAENDRALAPGEVGEICIGPARTGPWAGVYTPMLGYWRRPEASAEALRGGLYHTGDLGLLDAGGTLFVRGRRSELILRGGANVYPAEVERVLAEVPGVAGCAVLGIPDVRLGERVVAAVEPLPGAVLDAEAILAALRPRLARYKLPERIAIVAELPRNAMRKVIKRELAALFEGG